MLCSEAPMQPRTRLHRPSRPTRRYPPSSFGTPPRGSCSTPAGQFASPPPYHPPGAAAS